MHITDLTHVLDASGALAPVKGPARTLAQFLVDVVAHATAGADNESPAPACFKCRKSAVTATRAMDQAIVWACPACGAEGRISKWQGTAWDLTDSPGARG
jgi:ribosomal protein L37AE/L43A